jgi:DNA-binding MarR family transcriptional regulator
MSQTSQNSVADVALIKVLHDAADSLAALAADALAELDLTQSQVSLIWALGPDSPPMAMREVARKLRFDPSNITLMTDQLVAAGIVERRPHPTDGRQRVLVLTRKGLEIWSTLIERVRQRSPVFTLSRAEQEQLTRLLTKAQAG